MKLKDILQDFKDVEFEESLIKELEKHKKEYKVWKPEKGQEVFYARGDGGVVVDRFDPTNYFEPKYWDMGNVFETKEQAEEELAKRKAIVKVNRAIEEYNEGWEPDWIDSNVKNYFINYVADATVFKILYNTYNIIPTTLNYMKSKEIAEKILEEYEKELEIIFELRW